jgi:hypothetical protein
VTRVIAEAGELKLVESAIGGFPAGLRLGLTNRKPGKRDRSNEIETDEPCARTRDACIYGGNGVCGERPHNTKGRERNAAAQNARLATDQPRAGDEPPRAQAYFALPLQQGGRRQAQPLRQRLVAELATVSSVSGEFA